MSAPVPAGNGQIVLMSPEGQASCALAEPTRTRPPITALPNSKTLRREIILFLFFCFATLSAGSVSAIAKAKALAPRVDHHRRIFLIKCSGAAAGITPAEHLECALCFAAGDDNLDVFRQEQLHHLVGLGLEPAGIRLDAGDRKGMH